MSNLVQRILSILVLVPIVLGLLWVGGLAMQLFVAVLLLIAFYEFVMMAWLEPSVGIRFFIISIAAAYCGLAFFAILSLPLTTLLFILLAVWSSDIGGYVFGKSFGGPKLAPRISPNKTISGLIGACLFPAFILSFPLYPSLSQAFMAGIAVGVVGQIGDVSVSYLKRRVGVKDTGRIIPGHGGVLDRIDAFLLVVIIYWLLMSSGYGL